MNWNAPAPSPPPAEPPKPANPEPVSVPVDPEKSHERVRNDPQPGKSEHPTQPTAQGRHAPRPAAPLPARHIGPQPDVLYGITAVRPADLPRF